MAQKRYDRLTLNFRYGAKDHERAWRILCESDNKLAYIVNAVIVFNESQEGQKTEPITEDAVRKIISEVLKLGNIKKGSGLTQSMKKKTDSLNEVQSSKTGDIDKETQAQLVDGLDMFHR